MNKLRAVVAACLLATATAQACINSDATDREGRAFVVSGYAGEDLLETMSTPNAKRRPPDWDATIASEARKEPSRYRLNELAALLIRQGKYDAAIRLLLDIERLFPGHADTAANLGTALELAGHNNAALRWIRLGIRRDPDEHFHSEWLHVRILEAKAGKRDIASISGVKFSSDVVPRLPVPTATDNLGKAATPKQVAQAIEYQLYERMGFVQTKDAIVATLLADWATLHLAGGSLETAQAAYAAALRYGLPQDALMRKRIAYVRNTLARVGSEPPEGGQCEICTL